MMFMLILDEFECKYKMVIS